MPNSAGSDVVVVGNVGIDTNVFLSASTRMADILREEGHFASDVDHVGQAGGHTSRGFARLGVPISFVGTSAPTRWGGGCGPSWPVTAST